MTATQQRLYRQALLTLGELGMAEQVVSDVILNECQRPALPENHEAAAELRLVISACRRRRDLAGDTAWQSRHSGRRQTGNDLDCIAPAGLSGRERAALALVIFGGFGYVEAAYELAIAPDGHGSAAACGAIQADSSGRTRLVVILRIGSSAGRRHRPQRQGTPSANHAASPKDSTRTGRRHRRAHLACSSGAVEGHVNRPKVIKRQMYLAGYRQGRSSRLAQRPGVRSR
jgi:hypothetical protein